MSDLVSKFFDKIVDDDTTRISDGLHSAEFSGYFDTGCYGLNAILSGSLYGGVPDNKVTGLAGATSVGKTFFALAIIKAFLDRDPNSCVLLYDTEADKMNKLFTDRGIDPKRIIVNEPETIEGFKTHALKWLEVYSKLPAKQKPKMMLVLDSLSQLPTKKEMEDSTAGKDTRDMTKTQTIKAAFRQLRMKLSKQNIPFIVTAHVYASIGSMIPVDVISGGSGLMYSADAILTISKKKEYDSTNRVIGNFLRVKTFKSRLARENAEISLFLSYKTGLDKYFGLLELGEKQKVFKKMTKQYTFPDGSVEDEKKIYKNPEKYFTPDVMKLLEEAANREYRYGSAQGGISEAIEDADAGPDEFKVERTTIYPVQLNPIPIKMSGVGIVDTNLLRQG